MSRRTERLNKLIKQEVSELLEREVDDTRLRPRAISIVVGHQRLNARTRSMAGRGPTRRRGAGFG